MASNAEKMNRTTHPFLRLGRTTSTSPDPRGQSPIASDGHASAHTFGEGQQQNNKSSSSQSSKANRLLRNMKLFSSPSAPPIEAETQFNNPYDLEKARETRRIPIKPETTLEESIATSYTRKKSLALPPPVPQDAPDAQGTDDRPFPGAGTAEEPYMVDWQKDEPANPLKWRTGFRWSVTAHLAINCLCPVFTASAYVGGVENMSIKFYPLSEEVALLGVSLYILGQAFGPLVLAPMSEFLGRRNVFLLAFPFFVLFCMAGAVAPNVPSILIFRFIAGVAGSGQLAIIGGQVADLWAPEERIVPGGLASLTPLLGPVIGPIVAGFVAENVGFRPIFWIEFAFGLALYISWFFFVPETYAPILLRRKAARLQRLADLAGTNEHFISKYDKHRKSVIQTLGGAMTKPFELLFKEIMVLALSVYIAIVYGILYLLFTAFPYIFQFGRGWSLGLTGLALIGIGIGMFIGFILGKYQTKFYLEAKAALPPGEPVPPEVRLKMGCVGGIMIPLSLFAFAWTSLPQVPWILPILFSIPFGAGYIIIFTSIMLYLIDSYTLYAASALAANTVMRALFGAAFPLFGGYMYRNLGVGWAGTLLAFLSLACVPMPFLFIRYGAYLRRHSKYIPSGPITPTRPSRVRAFPHPSSLSSERTLAENGAAATYNEKKLGAQSDSPGSPTSPTVQGTQHPRMSSPELPPLSMPDPRVSLDDEKRPSIEEPQIVPVSDSEPADGATKTRLGTSRSAPVFPNSDDEPVSQRFGRSRGVQSTRSLRSPTMTIPEDGASATPISARYTSSPSPLRNNLHFSDFMPLTNTPSRGAAQTATGAPQVPRPPQLHINTNPSARGSRASFTLHFAPSSPRLELGLGSPSLRETLSGRGWLVGSCTDLTVPTEDGWREYEESLHENARL